jgi:MFS family permease
MMIQYTKNNGMRIFTIIWVGQLVSLLGGNLFGFAVGIWVLQKTESVTLFALITLCNTLPGLIIAPFAGAIADRYDRRRLMILGDTGAALSTLSVAIIIWSETPAMWPFYLALIFGTLANAFQWPAYHASIPMLVAKEQLGRVNGMIQTGQAVGMLLAPILGGVLVVTIGIAGVILIDFVTFAFAVITLLLVKIPMPERAPEETASGKQPSLWSDTAFGWRYIKARPGLLGLLLFLAALNLFATMVGVLDVPLVLSFANAQVLGIVLAAGGAGLLLGGMAMARWGDKLPRRIDGVLGGAVAAGLFMILYGVLPSAVLVGIAAFGFFFAIPIINTCEFTIWQVKVERDRLGRVLSTRRTIAQATQPIALLAAGPLADYIFEPALSTDGALAGTVGRVLGTGDGRGIGFMFVIIGTALTLVAISGYLYPRMRLVETELPDAIPNTPTPAKEPVDGPATEPAAA